MAAHSEHGLDEQRLEPEERAGTDRVRRHTAPEVLDRIDREAAERVARYRDASDDERTRRIEALDRTWDIERALEMNAAALALGGLAAGVLVDRRFLVLPGVVAAFLLQHAVSGWCPPVAVFRRLGLRTRREIDAEKYALKAQCAPAPPVPTRTPTGASRAETPGA